MPTIPFGKTSTVRPAFTLGTRLAGFGRIGGGFTNPLAPVAPICPFPPSFSSEADRAAWIAMQDPACPLPPPWMPPPSSQGNIICPFPPSFASEAERAAWVASQDPSCPPPPPWMPQSMPPAAPICPFPPSFASEKERLAWIALQDPSCPPPPSLASAGQVVTGIDATRDLTPTQIAIGAAVILAAGGAIYWSTRPKTKVRHNPRRVRRRHRSR